MATHSGLLVWRIPWTEEPGRLQWMGSDCKESRHNLATEQLLLREYSKELLYLVGDTAR